jgi:hypothetical protein
MGEKYTVSSIKGRGIWFPDIESWISGNEKITYLLSPPTVRCHLSFAVR